MIHISEISSYPRSLAQADTLCSSYVHEGDPEAVFLSFAEIHAELENAHLLSSCTLLSLWIIDRAYAMFMDRSGVELKSSAFFISDYSDLWIVLCTDS